MSRTPVEIADRIRALRRFLWRVVFRTFPIVAILFAIIFAAGTRVSQAAMNVVVIPAFIAFAVTWLSIAALRVLTVAQFLVMLRPGSGEAYRKDRE